MQEVFVVYSFFGGGLRREKREIGGCGEKDGRGNVLRGWRGVEL